MIDGMHKILQLRKINLHWSKSEKLLGRTQCRTHSTSDKKYLTTSERYTNWFCLFIIFKLLNISAQITLKFKQVQRHRFMNDRFAVAIKLGNLDETSDSESPALSIAESERGEQEKEFSIMPISFPPLCLFTLLKEYSTIQTYRTIILMFSYS